MTPHARLAIFLDAFGETLSAGTALAIQHLVRGAVEDAARVAHDRAQHHRTALTDPVAARLDGVVLNAFLLEADLIAARIDALR